MTQSEMNEEDSSLEPIVHHRERASSGEKRPKSPMSKQINTEINVAWKQAEEQAMKAEEKLKQQIQVMSESLNQRGSIKAQQMNAKMMQI